MKSVLKISALVVALLLSAGYLYSAFNRASNGLRDEVAEEELSGNNPRPGRGGGDRGERPSREEMEKRFREEVGITDEQQEQLEELRESFRNREGEGRRNFGEVMEEMNKILTPEQQTKMREVMSRGREEMQARMQRRMQQQEDEARETLSPADFDRWMEKREERIARWRERAGRGGPGGPGGRRGGGGGGENQEGTNNEQRN